MGAHQSARVCGMGAVCSEHKTKTKTAVQLRGRRFDLALISRKNKRRAGTRFNRRGVRVLSHRTFFSLAFCRLCFNLAVLCCC
eukprot:COSAG05_NODE_323_length_11408_cov_361.826156_12_plen_83_part_00